jgi:hypothetical protein
VSLTSFSQTDTNNKDSVVVIPSKIAKLIIKDLIIYDATKLELKISQELLLNTKNKVSTQYSIINQYQIKDEQYKQIISNYDLQILAYKNMTNDLQKELKKSKRKLLYNKLGFITIAGTLTYLYVNK